MDHRTFGIEIEAFTIIPKYDLAQKIEAALHGAGFEDHRVIVSGYHHNTSSTNISQWELKTDSSLNRRSLPFRSEGVECVSPVLKGEAGLKALKAVADIINMYCKVNRSCGLHVHHGVDRTEMIKVSKVWGKAESFVLNALPNSRRNNNYCRPWAMYGGSNPTDQFIENISMIRYVSLNLKSFNLRKTLEFRCAAGTTEYGKMAGWILFTQGLIEKASELSLEEAENIGFSSIEQVADFVRSACGGTTTDHRSKYRNGSLRRKLVIFLEYGPKSREEIIAEFGKSLPKARKVMMENGTIVKENGKYRLTGSGYDPHYAVGADFIISRFNLFNQA